MKEKVLIVAIVIPLFLGGIYFIDNRGNLVKTFESKNNKEKVVQALENYNKVDENKDIHKTEKLSINTEDIVQNIKGIWGNGIMCSYKLGSKPTNDMVKKYSNLAKKNIIISNRRYFNVFDSISYNKVFKNPQYKVSKVKGNIINDDKNSNVIKSSVNHLYTGGDVYKITVNSKNLECKPIFYTNGDVLRVDYKDCSFIYTKLN